MNIVKILFFKSKSGTPPNCKCDETFVFDEIHWYCRPWYLSTTTHIPVTYKYEPTCNAYQTGVYPDCHWLPCPKNALNPDGFQPNCRYNYTVTFKACEPGLVGSYPDCYKPCPAYRKFG